MNVLDSEYNSKVKSFFDLMHQQNLIPTINNPTSRKKFSNGYWSHHNRLCISLQLWNSYFKNWLDFLYRKAWYPLNIKYNKKAKENFIILKHNFKNAETLLSLLEPCSKVKSLWYFYVREFNFRKYLLRKWRKVDTFFP